MLEKMIFTFSFPAVTVMVDSTKLEVSMAFLWRENWWHEPDGRTDRRCGTFKAAPRPPDIAVSSELNEIRPLMGDEGRAKKYTSVG